MVHINLNMIFYTHVEHSPTKTTHISPSLERVPLHLNCDLSLHLFPAQALLSSLLGSSPSVFWSACLALPVRGPDGCCLWDAQRWPGYQITLMLKGGQVTLMLKGGQVTLVTVLRGHSGVKHLKWKVVFFSRFSASQIQNLVC